MWPSCLQISTILHADTTEIKLTVLSLHFSNAQRLVTHVSLARKGRLGILGQRFCKKEKKITWLLSSLKGKPNMS